MSLYIVLRTELDRSTELFLADKLHVLQTMLRERPDDDDGVYGRVMNAVGTLGLGLFYVVKLDLIPRNPNGKIRRKHLKRDIVDGFTRHDPTWPERVTLDPTELAEPDAKKEPL